MHPAGRLVVSWNLPSGAERSRDSTEHKKSLHEKDVEVRCHAWAETSIVRFVCHAYACAARIHKDEGATNAMV